MLKLIAVMVANFVNILKATDLYALNCMTYELYINKAFLFLFLIKLFH